MVSSGPSLVLMYANESYQGHIRTDVGRLQEQEQTPSRRAHACQRRRSFEEVCKLLKRHAHLYGYRVWMVVPADMPPPAFALLESYPY